MNSLKYLAGYSEETLNRVRDLITANKLGEHLRNKYPDTHDTRTDRALYDYAMALKQRYMRSAVPLSKVAFDNRLRVLQHALGTHTTVSRVQGGNLKAKREIRVASLFKDVAPEFLKMIVVHELAHIKQREHDKAFYQLCAHMEPDYHQYEFDLRLLLTQREVEGQPEG
jgi:UTP pyrophosphatase